MKKPLKKIGWFINVKIMDDNNQKEKFSTDKTLPSIALFAFIKGIVDYLWLEYDTGPFYSFIGVLIFIYWLYLIRKYDR